MAITIDKVKAVKKKYENDWLKLPGVVAVGIGLIDDTPGIIISLENLTDSPKLPSSVENIPIKLQESGSIRAQ